MPYLDVDPRRQIREGFDQRAGVRDIGQSEHHPVPMAEASYMFLPTEGQIVDDEHPVSASQKGAGEINADEPGAARDDMPGHECGRAALPSSALCRGVT